MNVATCLEPESEADLNFCSLITSFKMTRILLDVLLYQYEDVLFSVLLSLCAGAYKHIAFQIYDHCLGLYINLKNDVSYLNSLRKAGS